MKIIKPILIALVGLLLLSAARRFLGGPGVRASRWDYWLAHLLGLTAPSSDGSLNVLAGTLRDGGAEPDEKLGK